MPVASARIALLGAGVRIAALAERLVSRGATIEHLPLDADPHEVLVAMARCQLAITTMPDDGGCAIGRLLEECCDDIPVVVIVDDVRAIDRSAFDSFAAIDDATDDAQIDTIVAAALFENRRRAARRGVLRRRVPAIGRIIDGRFEFRTPREATALASLLALSTDEPERVSLGLVELFLNAIEHGNLGLGHRAKSELLEAGTLQEEISRRLALPENEAKVVTVRCERPRPGTMRFTIRDSGTGFDPDPFFDLAPERSIAKHGRGIWMARRMAFTSLRYERGGTIAVAEIDSLASSAAA